MRDNGVIERINAFCDAVPRRRTRAEEHGPLEVFVPVGMSWPYYARPRQGSRPPVTAADIRAVRARQRELIIPESFEWIEQSAPEMAAAAAEAGLEIRRHPLMVLAAPAPVPPLPPGITARIVAPEDAELDRIWAVPAVAFSHPGTAVGEAGVAERDKIAADHDGGTIAMLRERLRSGHSVLAAAFGPDGPLAAGSCQAVDGVAEITGVGVLPAHRRQGLGAAVTALLAADAAGPRRADHFPVRQRPRRGPGLRPDRVPRDRHGHDRRARPLAGWHPGAEGPRYGRYVLSRWRGGIAALIVTLITGVLIIGDLTDTVMRRWWATHALTTDTVSGLLVLLITLLVVDQVVRLRQINDRARAVAAQAAIIMTQAVRASRSVAQGMAEGADDGDRDAAADDLRTYMMMLMVGAPVLIDAKVSRNFLEQAQAVAGLMALAQGATAGSASAASAGARLDGAVQALQAASTPLLRCSTRRPRRPSAGTDRHNAAPTRCTGPRRVVRR